MTDTILIKLSAKTELSSLLAACERLGAVSSVEVLPDDEGSNGAAKVVFFDTRAVQCALQSFGLETAQATAPTRSRIVKLQGSAQLSRDDIDKVSDVFTESDGDSYTLEFYDSRDARRVEKMAKLIPGIQNNGDALQTSETSAVPNDMNIGPPPGLKSPAVASGIGSCSRTSGAKSLPTERHKMVMSPWGTLPLHGLGMKTFQVHIQGLPKAMLPDATFEAVLQQACLESPHLLHFITIKGSKTGEALVTLSSAAAAMACVQHFNGCLWNGSGKAKAVTAKIIAVKEAGVPIAAAAMMSPTRGPEAVTGAVATCFRVNSDASTDAGESAMEDEK